MQRTRRLVRAYRSSDTYMVNTAQTICALLAANLGRFTAFDSTIDAAFVADFEDKVAAAQQVISDNVVIDVVAEKTEEVQRVLVEAATKFDELRYYILKAFPDSRGTQEQAGLSDYRGARRSARLMVDFLQLLHTMALERLAELEAVGYTAAKVAEIDTIRQSLMEVAKVQSLAKADRPRSTEDRVRILNACYAKLVQVNALAQIVFADSTAMQGQFVFRPVEGKGGKK